MVVHLPFIVLWWWCVHVNSSKVTTPTRRLLSLARNRCSGWNQCGKRIKICGLVVETSLFEKEIGHRERLTDRQTFRQSDRQTETDTDRHRGRLTDRQIYIQTERQTDRETDRQRQTDRQTETYRDKRVRERQRQWGWETETVRQRDREFFDFNVPSTA